MTENEAIEILRNNFPKTCKMVDGRYKGGFDDTECEFGKALLLSISALVENQQYRAIGTVEECREAVEKQRAKKPVPKPFYEDMDEEYLCCPNCGDILTDRIPMDNKDFYFHCLNCGQKLDWG